MTEAERVDLVVVGMGGAGLSSALSAIESVQKTDTPEFSILVLERARKENRSGSTFFSTSDWIPPTVPREEYIASFADRTRNAHDYVRTLAYAVGPTIEWLTSHGVRFSDDNRTYLTAKLPRTRPVGGGAGIVTPLAAKVEGAARGVFFGKDGANALAVEIRYETAFVDLTLGADGAVDGVIVQGADGRRKRIATRAVILACGGFQGNPEMMTRYVGYDVPTISRGTSHNRGEGIEAALAVGAKPTGQWNQFHPLPADPRTSHLRMLTFTAIMETVPYSIVVNVGGERFLDEGANSMNDMYDVLARAIQAQPRQLAYAIFDNRPYGIKGWDAALRRDLQVEPYEAGSLAELASLIGVPAATLERTVAAYNAATPKDLSRFDPYQKDGLATTGLPLPKSNWATSLVEPPFRAFPVTCANVLCFGGIGTNEKAEVITRDDAPIPGLFAAGEIVGLYFHDYVGATSVTRGCVYGRIAGANAVAYATRPG